MFYEYIHTKNLKYRKKNLSTTETCPYKIIIKNIEKLIFIFVVDGGYHRSQQLEWEESMTMDGSGNTGDGGRWELERGGLLCDSPLHKTAAVLMNSHSCDCLQKTCPKSGQSTEQYKWMRAPKAPSITESYWQLTVTRDRETVSHGGMPRLQWVLLHPCVWGSSNRAQWIIKKGGKGREGWRQLSRRSRRNPDSDLETR